MRKPSACAASDCRASAFAAGKPIKSEQTSRAETRRERAIICIDEPRCWIGRTRPPLPGRPLATSRIRWKERSTSVRLALIRVALRARKLTAFASSAQDLRLSWQGAFSNDGALARNFPADLLVHGHCRDCAVSDRPASADRQRKHDLFAGGPVRAAGAGAGWRQSRSDGLRKARPGAALHLYAEPSELDRSADVHHLSRT